jgi:glycosyltransferase involved in cell wall biosynthesis
MRALFIRPNLAAGGAERQLSILLPGLRDRGIDARLIALDRSGPFEAPLRLSGVPLEVLNMRHQADLGRLLRSRLLRGFAPDVIVSQGVSGLYVGQVLASLRRAVHIYLDHRQVGLRLTRRREAMVRLSARRLDWVIAVSAEQAGSWLQRRFPAERIQVIGNGVEAPRVSASKAQLRQELGFPAGAVVALLVARLRPEKRIGDFVRAVVAAREAAPGLIGLVAGDGPERAAVESAIDGEHGVRLLGHRDDVDRLLKAADIFVLTSEHEAVPMAVLEAMAAGLPVLATSVGDVPSVVAHGESGFLVSPYDVGAMAARLTELAADRELRLALGAAGARRQRDGWSSEAMIDGYAEFLRKSCASS